jgi:hypothetical protein
LTTEPPPASARAEVVGCVCGHGAAIGLREDIVALAATRAIACRYCGCVLVVGEGGSLRFAAPRKG